MALLGAVFLTFGGVTAAQAWYDVGGGVANAANPLLVSVETTIDQMTPEMADAYVYGIQEELHLHGYRPGRVDGIAGRQTRSAISAYQRDAGLPVTGNASKELLDHLKFVLPKVYAKPAPSGPSQELVRDVQRRLSVRGYYLIDVDGLMGPATRDAVRQFQTDAGLPVTGAVDQRLLAELDLADHSVNRD
jgi:peptidoglycan hydrolase-like protein with peptidoglycan-binding domain